MPVLIDALHNELRIELPGIPEPTLALAVKKTVQDFFKMSESWRYTSPILLDWTIALGFPAIVAGTDIPTDTRVVRIDTVKYADDSLSLERVRFATRQQLDTLYSDWEVKDGNSPLAWTNDGPGTPRIIPIAVEDKLVSLQVRSIIAPTDDLADLPDYLYYEFEDVFKNGALARLMKIPGKDWTNLAAAGAYAGLFRQGWVKAKSRANAEFGQPVRNTSYGGL